MELIDYISEEICIKSPKYGIGNFWFGELYVPGIGAPSSTETDAPVLKTLPDLLSWLFLCILYYILY